MQPYLVRPHIAETRKCRLVVADNVSFHSRSQHSFGKLFACPKHRQFRLSNLVVDDCRFPIYLWRRVPSPVPTRTTMKVPGNEIAVTGMFARFNEIIRPISEPFSFSEKFYSEVERSFWDHLSGGSENQTNKFQFFSTR